MRGLAAVLVAGVMALAVVACGGGTAATDATGGDPAATDPGGGEAPAGEPGDVVIVIKDSGFEPAELSVSSGTRLVIRNEGTSEHSFISDDISSFNTFLFGPGEEEVVYAVVAGIYPFHCEAHPNLKGTLTIEE